MGDVLLTLPAVAALKRRLPGASLTYVIEESFLELVENHPALDHVLVLPRPVGNRDFIRFIRDIRKNRFDVVLDFHGGPRASLITLFSGAKRKIGYKNRFKWWIYHTAIPRYYDFGPVHSAENHLNLVRVLGVDAQESPPISFPPADPMTRNEADDILRTCGLISNNYIVFHIGAGNQFRFWGRENMSAFLSQAFEAFGLSIVLVGAPDDAETEGALLEAGNPAVVSLVGRISLKILHHLISQAALFVGPDSGPMHVASATSTPVIALFGPNLPVYFGPWKSECVILEKILDCRPCPQRNCPTGDFACI
ncbi:MAG: glycosyltransferase family 9 protein, partial [Candidatus Aminicenantes bacterium]|nr:glycosyltransferase family 9 protein [Candidatus Aminicenantes bacterium]